MMAEPATICFVGTDKIKHWLEQQAQADDRSVSYILRQILEEKRRQTEAEKQLVSVK